MLKMFYDEEKIRLAPSSLEEECEQRLGALDLFHDPAMEQFFFKGLRGEQSFIATREATGNANPETEGNHLLYVDGI